MSSGPQRRIEVVWCDDIRLEVGNKPSLMGVYTGVLGVASLPCVLDKLCAFVQVFTTAQQPFTKLVVHVMKGDGAQPLGSVELPAGDLSGQQVVALAMVVGQVQLTADTRWLQVRVETESEHASIESVPLQVAATASL